MSEAEYLDSWSDYDFEEEELGRNVAPNYPLFEVVDWRDIQVFMGSRAACWEFKRRHGGWVQPAWDEEP